MRSTVMPSRAAAHLAIIEMGDQNAARSAIRRLLHDQIEEIWGKGRTTLVAANYAETISDHMPAPGQLPGRAALATIVEQFRAGIADLRMEMHATLVAGDYGVDVWTLTGTHAGPLLGHSASGRPIAIAGIDMVRVEDGRICEMWHVEELALLTQQIGVEAFAFGAPQGAHRIVAAPMVPDTHPRSAVEVPGEADFTAREQRNLAIARRHIEDLWGAGRAELAQEIFHPAVVDHNPAPGQRPGIAGILDVLHWLREAVPDLVLTAQAFVVEGDLVCDRWRMTGTHTGAALMGIAAQGRRFAISGMDVVRIDDDGLITDVWHAEEFAQLRAQIG
jgi:predicted ester cyclase